MELNGKQPESTPEKDILLSHWTDERRTIHLWLQDEAPSLAELYESAVRLRFEIKIPGRVRLICHCLREICNRLIIVKVGTKKGGRFNYVKPMNKLSGLWKGKGFPIDGILTDSGINSQANLPSSSPDIVIPRELFFEIANIIKEHEETSSQIDRRFELFFVECVPENQYHENSLRPQAEQWKELYNWFVGKAHDNGTVDANYDEDSLVDNFQLFEQVLITLAQSFYKTTDKLDEILEEANYSTN
ncbi:MAG: hypothetical protein ACK4YS_02720 [Aphanizomenon sp.]